MPLITSSPSPRIILGTMTFGPDPEQGARVTDLAEYNKCLDYFQSQGFNEIDTARIYVGGKQEAFTRDAKWQERGLTLATKWYPRQPGQHKPEVLTEAVNTSLKELGTDCVDIFYLHAADRSVPFEETLRCVNELHKQGKFVRLGLSNYTAAEVAEVVMVCKYNNWVRPTIYQAMYNAWTRSIENELAVTCRRFGMDIVVYNPLAAGFFSGKYKTSDIPKEGRFSETHELGGKLVRSRYFKDAAFDALKIIEPIAKKHNLTLIEVALRWLVHHSTLNVLPEKGGKDGIIIGVSSMKQLEENLKACKEGPLPEDVVKALDEGWKLTKATTPNYFHGVNQYTYDTQKALFG